MRRLCLPMPGKSYFSDGLLGVVIPRGLQSNQSCGGLRHFLMRRTSVNWWLQFRNQKRLFTELGTTERYILLVLSKGLSSREDFQAAFELDSFDVLRDLSTAAIPLSPKLLEAFSGPSLIVPTCASRSDWRLPESAAKSKMSSLFEWLQVRGIHCGEELHMTNSRGLFTPPRESDVECYPLLEGKSINPVYERLPRTSVLRQVRCAERAEASGVQPVTCVSACSSPRRRIHYDEVDLGNHPSRSRSRKHCVSRTQARETTAFRYFGGSRPGE
jgi:hypothetical protein